MNEPLYTHDCASCSYVGVAAPAPGEPRCNGVDLYFHRNPSGRLTLIRRFGSDGADYASHSVQRPSDIKTIKDCSDLSGKWLAVLEAAMDNP